MAKKKTFTYGGYTFEPRGTFKDNGIKDDFKSLCSVLHYITRDEEATVADGDEPYSYDEFFKAAGQQADDIFYCPETGELYVPCHCSLAVLDTAASWSDIKARCNRRRAERERLEQERKTEALRSNMYFTEEQHQAFIALGHAIDACREQGLDFAVRDSDVLIFRADLLADITDNMAPMEGQTLLPQDSMPYVITDAWNAHDGLYANVKS